MKELSNKERAKDFQRWRKAKRIQTIAELEKNAKYPTKERDYYLRKMYGISGKEYYDLLEKQNFCCPICLKHYTMFNKLLSVDHDHVTGRIRGLLCPYDNTHTIGRERDPERLARAASYLREENQTNFFVPKQIKALKRSNIQKSYTEYFFNKKKDESPND
jgi:hypothetical protein